MQNWYRVYAVLYCKTTCSNNRSKRPETIRAKMFLIGRSIRSDNRELRFALMLRLCLNCVSIESVREEYWNACNVRDFFPVGSRLIWNSFRFCIKFRRTFLMPFLHSAKQKVFARGNRLAKIVAINSLIPCQFPRSIPLSHDHFRLGWQSNYPITQLSNWVLPWVLVVQRSKMSTAISIVLCSQVWLRVSTNYIGK